MRRFDPRHKDLGPKPALDLFRVRTLQEELDRLPEISRRLFNSRPLTGHRELIAREPQMQMPLRSLSVDYVVWGQVDRP
jgi:hypothetical protein